MKSPPEVEHPAPFGTRLSWWAIIGGLALVIAWLLLAAEHVGILRSLGWVYTDEDQAVLWLGAVDYSHLRFHEPRFYGQAYNSMFESLLAVPLLWLGVPVWTAVPLVSALASLAAWTCLAGLALKQRQMLAGVTILVLPLLLDPRFLLISTMPRGFMPGVFLSVVAATLWLWRPEGRFRTLGAVFLLGCGCSLNPNALLVAVPFGTLVLCRVWDDAPKRLQVGVGTLGACVVHGLIVLFYVRHRSYVVHSSPSLSVSWEHWLWSLHSLHEIFGAFLPLDASRAFLLVVVVATIVALGRRRAGPGPAAGVGSAGPSAEGFGPQAGPRSPFGRAQDMVGSLRTAQSGRLLEPPLFLLTLVAVVVFSLAVEKVAEWDPDRLFMPRARMFLGLPFSVSLLLLLIRLRPHAAKSVVCIALLIGATISFAQRQQARTSYVESAVARSVAAHPWVRPWRVDAVRERCELLRVTSEARGLKLSLHWKDQLPAYACTAVCDGEFLGIFPKFERRRWLVERLKPMLFDRVMMADVTREECDRLDQLDWKCLPLVEEGNGMQLVELRFRPQPLSSVAHSLVDFYGGDPEDW